MLSLADKLPEITARQRQWALDHSFMPRAVYWPRKGEVRCLCCGQTAVWPKAYIEACVDVEEYDCPYCGKATSIEQYCRGTEMRERRLFTILTTFRGHQVARTFEVSRANYRDEHFARYDIAEIYQIWILDDGREIITGRECHRSAFYLTWEFNKPLCIRQHNASCTGAYAMEDLYDISGNLLYPEIRVTPLLRRNGWNRRLVYYRNSYALTDAMRWLLGVPTAEMLVKTGQYALFRHMMRRKDRQLPFLHSVRIANRNGYIVKDAQMWLDMLAMAAQLGKDTHNPKVVCPADLRQAHDALLAPIARRRRKAEAAERLREAAKWETIYRQSKSRYFGICFGSGDIVITVIKSVAEMAEEGDKMHHCVYKAGYYKRDDSLILSARDRDGNRLETIELSLKTLKVIQSRGRFNKSTPRHDEILQLIQNNLNLFKTA